MQRVRAAAVLALCLATAPAARAGLYSTAEPRWSLGGDIPPKEYQRFKEFRDKTLIPLRQIVSEESRSPLNRQYTLIATLGGGGRATLIPEQRLNLGACYIRLGKARDAANALMPAQRQEPDNFLVLANLATAEQLDGQLRRAHDSLADALRLWKERWHDFPEARQKWLERYHISEPEHEWYRQVETYHLKLLKLRLAERAGDALPEAPDALFGPSEKNPVRFVGDSGQFEVGKIAVAERAKLPRSAIEIVQQLLVWLPHDMRLYWLLGELFNAEGNIEAARDIFGEIAVKWNPPTDKTFGFKQRPSYPKLFETHLKAIQAHPREEVIIDLPKEPAPGVDWRTLGIGFGSGLLVALFAHWQVRELRRRRQARAAVRAGG